MKLNIYIRIKDRLYRTSCPTRFRSVNKVKEIVSFN